VPILRGGSGPVRDLGLDRSDDRIVWQHAKDNGFVLVSQDSDFADMAAHYGHPPKVIWLRCENQRVVTVEALLRRHAKSIAEFGQNITAACLKYFDPPSDAQRILAHRENCPSFDASAPGAMRGNWQPTIVMLRRHLEDFLRGPAPT
jgi:predicted nuclease of predicted toxin-antitoxin system